MHCNPYLIQDLKGVIYLVGLLIAATLTILLGTALPTTSDNTSGMPIQSPFAKAKCNQLTLGSDGPISKLPLSQTVFGYTLAYLSYFISINNLQATKHPHIYFIPNINLSRYDLEYIKWVFYEYIITMRIN